MRRAIPTAALLILAAMQAPRAWNTTTICVEDLSGRPYPKATVSYQYHTGDGFGTLANLTNFTGCTAWDGGGAGFDSIWNLKIIDSLHLDTIAKPGTITYAEVNGGTIPNQAKNGDYGVTDTVPFYSWTPSTNAADSGTFIIPGVPQQIIYDPPGDGSYASLAKGASFQNSVTTSFGYGAGASLTAGYSFDAGVASADVEVSASVDYKHNTDNQFTATVQTNNSMNTGTSTDPAAVGPGRGDLFVVPTLTMHWHLYYSHVPTDPHAYPADGNVYKLFYQPIANAQNVLRVIDASNIASTFDTATAARLLGASVIDPKTHRIRDSLVDHASGATKTSRLTLLSSLSSFTGGGGSSEQDSTGTVSQQTTVSYSVDIGASASAKIGIGGATAGATLTASLTMGGQSSTNTTYSRTIAMALSDANPWDVLTYRLYRDNVYGVYVWDVDSAQSWTSLPFEAGYSSPSVAWKISNDHDTLRVDAGQDTTFHVMVQNLDRSQPALDTMLVGASLIQNSGLSASVDPSGFKVVLDSTGTANVSVTNPPMGVYRLVLNLTGTVNSGAVQALSGYDTLTLAAGIPTGLGESARHEILGARGRTLQVGVEPGVDWTLRSVDARGRLLQERSGRGPSQVELPQASGLVFTRLVTASQRADLVTSGVR